VDFEFRKKVAASNKHHRHLESQPHVVIEHVDWAMCEGRKQFIDAVQPISPGLVIIEIDEPQLTSCMLAGIYEVRQHIKATFIIVHRSKGRGRGNEDLYARADTALRVKRQGKGLLLINDKQRDGIPVPPHILDVSTVRLSETHTGRVVTRVRLA
jgi:hypothetical protein